MLRLDAVKAGYGDSTILWDLSLEVGANEAVALLGRNGMGKTTTLRAILGLTTLRSGRISFEGTDLEGLRTFEIARRGIGYAPEGRRLFATLSVEENLRVPFASKHPDRRQWRAQRDRVFALFPALEDRRQQTAGSLSGGEQQMLAIARAMIGGDRLLLLDEPTEGLAPAVVSNIIAALNTLKRDGISVLLVEQNVQTALAVADRAYVLEKGRTTLSATAAQFAQDRSLLDRYLGVDETR